MLQPIKKTTKSFHEIAIFEKTRKFHANEINDFTVHYVCVTHQVKR